MRIQILPLPSVVVGDDVQEPFALIVDQWPEGAYDSSLQGFADMCGAKAVWVRSETVEVVDRYAEAPAQQGGTATDKIRNLRDTQGWNGTWNASDYMRGLYNGLELALAVLEGERDPQFKDAPAEDGYLCDRPTPDMSGPEYAPVDGGD